MAYHLWNQDCRDSDQPHYPLPNVQMDRKMDGEICFGEGLSPGLRGKEKGSYLRQHP